MQEARYPRMLFRGDETSRADSRDEMLAKRGDGWRARLLPGESPEDIGETTAEPDDPPVVVPPRRGRPPKAVE